MNPETPSSVLALARADLACYSMAQWPPFELAAHHRIIIDKLEAVERGDVRRLMIFLPPRHGKSFAVAITGLGIGAHVFKAKNQKLYGIVETLVGFVTALIVAGTLGPNNLDLAKWTTLIGSAYVIARGLGNYTEGKKKLTSPTEPRVV